MIIANVIGGLGNQMFQYAAGRSVANREDVPLKLDTRYFGNYSLHNGFELSRVFNIEASLATSEDFKKMLGWRQHRKIISALQNSKFSLFRGNKLIFDPHFHYWKEIENVSSNCYLHGYWQSERYFLTCASSIRREFTFTKPLIEKNRWFAERISSGNSVSLHIRRGDYLNNKTNMAIHGICSIDYYHNAINLISEWVDRPTFFIFSDDISWAKENLSIDSLCYFIDHNRGQESYNDMHLMSLCQNHIIANSTFSWWGAWLNYNASKKVIATKKWFGEIRNTEDLLPKEWIQI